MVFREKWLDKKVKVIISKFVTTQTWKQIITIHILPNILRSKDIQKMKFGQFTEPNQFIEHK